MAIPKRIKIERVYVKVASEFDSTGYMQPKSITWADGRTFPIETVRDFRPAGTADNDCNGDCFTVLIQGQEKHLFFEHVDPRFTGRLGRWYAEINKLLRRIHLLEDLLQRNDIPVPGLDD